MPETRKPPSETPLILASASPRRQALLQSLGIAPQRIMPAELDESTLPGELAAAYVARIARSKAQHIAQQNPGDIVLAADTTVALGRRILQKADDEATARQFLALLSGRRHRVLTCVAVVKDGMLRSKTVTSVVRFSRLAPSQMETYIASGEWQGKAGAYAIQGRAAAFIPFISGSHSNVVGLPLYETAQLLQWAGILPAGG